MLLENRRKWWFVGSIFQEKMNPHLVLYWIPPQVGLPHTCSPNVHITAGNALDPPHLPSAPGASLSSVNVSSDPYQQPLCLLGWSAAAQQVCLMVGVWPIKQVSHIIYKCPVHYPRHLFMPRSDCGPELHLTSLLACSGLSRGHLSLPPLWIWWLEPVNVLPWSEPLCWPKGHHGVDLIHMLGFVLSDTSFVCWSQIPWRGLVFQHLYSLSTLALVPGGHLCEVFMDAPCFISVSDTY